MLIVLTISKVMWCEDTLGWEQTLKKVLRVACTAVFLFSSCKGVGG